MNIRNSAIRIASEQSFYDDITQKYIKQFQRVPGVKEAFLQEWDNRYDTGRKCWFTIYLQTNYKKDSFSVGGGRKRYFTKKLDYIQRALNRICFRPDRIYNIMMPSKIRYKNMFNEWSYKYDVDYVTFEIFIYNEEQR